MPSITISAPALRSFCLACLDKAGVLHSHAQLVAENLLFANLRGVDSHGVIRLKVYLDRIKAGGFKANLPPVIVSQSESAAVMDGQSGLGQVAAMAAITLAAEKARSTGAAVVTVRNSNHFGACAFYALRAVEMGCIGIVATNAGPTMAPTGGREGRLGNNAFAVAVPAGHAPPLVLDMATGAAAWGKIFVAQQENRKIPTSWALDKYGMPTDDPNAAADKGLIQPMAGYKGYGLSLLIDLFAGVLSGSGFSTGVNTLYQHLDQAAGTGQVCAAIHVPSFLPLAEFTERAGALCELMRSCPRAEGVDRIYLPGDIERETAERRSAEGIPINAALAEELRTVAAEWGVEAPF